MTTPDELFTAGINWELLKEQKQDLLYIINDLEAEGVDVGSLQGILHLIDALQDCAVDYYGRNKNEVFHFTNEEENGNK